MYKVFDVVRQHFVLARLARSLYICNGNNVLAKCFFTLLFIALGL